MPSEPPITRPIWLHDDHQTVRIIDQRRLPHELIITDLTTVDDVIRAIKEMYVRGAPLIGVTAAWGVYIAALNARTTAEWTDACRRIKAARPTAVLDALLYLLMGDVLTCYRCHCEYRGAEGLEEHAAFDLEVHEKYRQQAARLAQAGLPEGGAAKPANPGSS